jgi:CheY-like chemotaxis protein
MPNSTFHFVVIDDDNVNNMVCTAAIKTATDGAALPVCFTNPEEGLKYMENEYLPKTQGAPTILFLDLSMPGMSGWDWLFKFEQFPQTIKQNVIIYVLSASVNPADFKKANDNIYVNGYIFKPLNKEKVIGILESHHLTVKKAS